MKYFFYIYSQYKHLVKLLIKFASVGLLGFVVDSLLYFALMYFGLSHLAARFISYWVATTNNWFFNRIFTYKHINKRPKFKQWTKYLSVALVSFFINWGSYYFLTEFTLLHNYKYIAFICGIGVAFMFNFVMVNLVVFDKTANINNNT